MDDGIERAGGGGNSYFRLIAFYYNFSEVAKGNFMKYSQRAIFHYFLINSMLKLIGEIKLIVALISV